MKVLALNGSPRMKSSSTYHMLDPLLEGMREAGAETEVLHLRKLDLRACIGCYTCWVRTPGKCIFHEKDEMASALTAYNSADLVIFGTPLYHYSMTGIMKDFIDRTLVRIEPWLVPHPDVPDMTFHPERFHSPDKKMMLVSPCGFPEFENFDALTATFRQFAEMERLSYVGEILRPQAETLSRKTHQPLFGDYYEKLRIAGREIISNGAMSDESQAALREDLFAVEKEVFYSLAEGYWTEQMDRFKVPDDERHTIPVLASDLDSAPHMPGADGSSEPEPGDNETVSNRLLAEYLAAMYRAEVMPDLRVTVQLNFSMAASSGFDAGPAHWYLVIEEGSCHAKQGVTPVPSLTINTPNHIWRMIGAGELDAVAAFTEGDYEAEGSMTLLGLFPELFEYPRP